MNKSAYTQQELYQSYEALGVADYDAVYITGNLGRLGSLQDRHGDRILAKGDIVDAHLKAIETLLGPHGTIIFPTHSWQMVRSAEPFDVLKTPGNYLIGEYGRTLRDSTRQQHPFSSVAAIGVQKEDFIRPGLHRHAYGLDSPFEKLAQANALHLSLGLEARRTISAVHHCEAIAQVPYRFTKAFKSQIVTIGGTREEEVFLNVTYMTTPPLERDHNNKIMALPELSTVLKAATLGRGTIQSLPLGTFVDVVTRQMLRDPYIWLKTLPASEPWS